MLVNNISIYKIKIEKLNICKKNISFNYLDRPNKEVTDFCHMPTVYDC